MEWSEIVDAVAPETYERFKDRLVRGEGNTEAMPIAEWRASGLADGVVFLGGVPGRFTSLEREALSYVKANPLFNLLTPDGKQNMEISWGLCIPDFNCVVKRYPEIATLAEEQERPVKWLLTSNKRGIEANQPAHALRWVLVPIPDAPGIWAVFYDSNIPPGGCLPAYPVRRPADGGGGVVRPAEVEARGVGAGS